VCVSVSFDLDEIFVSRLSHVGYVGVKIFYPMASTAYVRKMGIFVLP
jgi:hypothetical protein